jgi:hypothetical protein
MPFYMLGWALITIFLGAEYWSIGARPGLSILLRLQKAGLIHGQVTTEAGGGMSLWLGWIGLGLMLAMNFYSLRKRFPSLSSLGTLPNWLDFHVFCGLAGPTFILFHCNLKVRGIVGISFWSMIVSLASGLIGRYFYLQVAGKESDLENLSARWLAKLDAELEKKNIAPPEEIKTAVLAQALDFVGGRGDGEAGEAYLPLTAIFYSIAGDLRLLLSKPMVPAEWPQRAAICVTAHALSRRKAQFLYPYQRIMGHWHSLHFPFAVFMYLAAAVHVASSMFFLRSR